MLLDDEKLPGAAALNEALAPYWPVLWRVAARGHYFVHRQPVRDSGRRDMVHRAAIPSVEEYFGPKKTEDAKFRLSFARGVGHDFDVLLSFPGTRGPLYPLAPYPMIAEFRAMLAALTPKARPPQHWDGEYFYGYVTERASEPEFWFRAHANAITFGFSAEEWKAVRELFRRAWEMPEVRIAWNALTLEYGEL